ncbi:MAG: carboxypeptidase-like regulatory domain-containing protein [Pirellulaceae bacterium]
MVRLNKSSVIASWTLSCLVAVVVGCSSDSRPAGIPVRGMVAFKGQPVKGADVAFSGDNGAISAFARTDENGKFEMNSLNTQAGIPPGTYRVKITQVSVQSDWTPEHDEGVRPKKTEKLGIPAKYAGYASSGLTAVVSEGEPNEVNFDLK